MRDGRVLVVGTTADYIDLINSRYPGRALFVTDFRERQKAREAAPGPGVEVLADLSRAGQVNSVLLEHLERRHQKVSGVTSFDCESMELAAHLAASFGLPYPSPEVIRLVRDKFRTKQVWQERGVSSPRAALVESERDALSFGDRVGYPLVLKPLTGSGSELTFKCLDRAECARHFHLVKSGLAARDGSRMYSAPVDDAGGPNPLSVIVAEEFVEGSEYSCDFIIESDCVRIIRVAGKIRSTSLAFGTTLAYLLPAELPDGLDRTCLAERLRSASRALGIDRAVCMVDFIVRDKQPCFLELTPRPGGDCLPPLIMRSCGLDMLGLALDFAEGRPITVPPESEWSRLVGARMFAATRGTIRRLNTTAVTAHPGVAECYLKRATGHVVKLPPEDYDSWLLGHVIFRPSSLDYDQIEQESEAIASRLDVEFETRHDQKFRGLRSSHRRLAKTADTSA